MEWTEISDELENLTSYDGEVLKFTIGGFTAYVYRSLQKLKNFAPELVHHSVIPFGVNIFAPDEVLEDCAIFL